MSITLKNVNKVYNNGSVKTVALKDINIKIEEGEFIVILGPSGSGKSTLLNVVSGLDRPTSGEIYCYDEKISDYEEEELTKFRRKKLGFIFQQYNLLQNITVKDNIEIGAAIGENPLDTEEVLKLVSLQDQSDKYPSQLSGGQQQRVSIARCIAKNPKIMFCDEPTGALDEKTGKQILDIIQSMNEKYKMTTVVITHNANIALMADRVLKMNSGEIIEIIQNKSRRKASDISWA